MFRSEKRNPPINNLTNPDQISFIHFFSQRQESDLVTATLDSKGFDDVENNRDFSKSRKETDALSQEIDSMNEGNEGWKVAYAVSVDKRLDETYREGTSQDVTALFEQVDKIKDAIC